jgi:large subunit ribosomal protein L25
MILDMIVDVQPRQEMGKNEARRIRRQGMMPAIVYGGDREPVPISVDPKTLQTVLRSEAGSNAVFSLRLGGQEDRKRAVMIREIQRDPIDGDLIHADFVCIDMSQEITVKVPVRPVGTAVGVKSEGGLLDFVQREVELACLPGNIPGTIEVDVSELHIGEHIEVGQINLPENVRLVSEPGQTLVVIATPREEVAAEAAAPAEGEVAEEAAEPEVSKKGKEAAAEEPAEGKGDDKTEKGDRPSS